jgi:hypothetical protein
LNWEILNIEEHHIIIVGDIMNEKTMGAITFLLAVVLAILALAVPGLFYWLFWLVVVILIVYGLYMWLIRK